MDPAINLDRMLTWPRAVTAIRIEYVILNVPHHICDGSEQLVLSGLSGLKSEFFGTSKFQLLERKKIK